MRCPSCGTENAPDSRFCGGCGARLGASAQRLAPTQKISDDASYPQRPAASGGGHGGQAVAQPGGGPRPVPPAAYAPAPQPSAPPPRAISSAPPAVQATARPPNGSQLDDPSLSMPIVARRPWGLIIFLLLLDLGLGAAGIWMLIEGLGDKPSAKSAAPRSSASATPASAVATGATDAPIEPRTAAAGAVAGEATATAATGSAAPATGAGDPAITPTAATGSTEPSTGSAAPSTGSAAPSTGSATPERGSAAPEREPANTAAPAGTGSAAAPADKPVKRHRKTEKKPTGAASGPVDPYATSAPRPAPSPPASP
jgi:hypothetical protein